MHIRALAHDVNVLSAMTLEYIHSFAVLDVEMYCSNVHMNESLCYSNRCTLTQKLAKRMTS